MQLFVTDKGFVYVVLMKSQSEIPQALKIFAKEIGAPSLLICDSHQAQQSDAVRRFCHKIGTSLKLLEEGSQWSNRAELYIGLFKEVIWKDIHSSECPLIFWNYCAQHRAQVHNLTARNLFQLEGCNPNLTVMGEEGDISNLCQFDWYDFRYYRNNTATFPMNHELLGRVLGPTSGEGNAMS